MHTGPNIERDGLVFGYDTGHGISDNQTSTRFYKGKPTENLLALAGADTDLERSGAAPSYSYHSVNITSYVQSRWASGNNVLVQSFEGKREYVGGGTGGGNDGYPRMYVYFSDWSWSSSFGISSYDWSYGKQILTMPNPTGKTVYMTIYHMNSQNPGRSYSRKHSVSFNTIDTPYVKGSRSSTDSLIDLTKSTDIDVSNVSFDSTGQPTFDGTDDRIVISNPLTVSQPYTILIWCKPDSLGTGASSANRSTPLKGNGHWNPGIWVTQDMIRSHGISHYVDSYIDFNPGEYAQIGMIYNGSNVFNIFNGVILPSYYNPTYSPGTPTQILIGTETTGVASTYWNGSIDSTKIYNRVLTPEEVKQNYNSHKNRFDI